MKIYKQTKKDNSHRYQRSFSQRKHGISLGKVDFSHVTEFMGKFTLPSYTVTNERRSSIFSLTEFTIIISSEFKQVNFLVG